WMTELCRSLGVNRGVLKLACGNRPLLGGHNHDFQRRAAFVETVHDLSQFPWPWPNESFDRVIAEDLLEHIDDIESLMGEVHRVLRPGGKLRLQLGVSSRDPNDRLRGCLLGHGPDSQGEQRKEWRIVSVSEDAFAGDRKLIWELEPAASY